MVSFVVVVEVVVEGKSCTEEDVVVVVVVDEMGVIGAEWSKDPRGENETGD